MRRLSSLPKFGLFPQPPPLGPPLALSRAWSGDDSVFEALADATRRHDLPAPNCSTIC